MNGLVLYLSSRGNPKRTANISKEQKMELTGDQWKVQTINRNKAGRGIYAEKVSVGWVGEFPERKNGRNLERW